MDEDNEKTIKEPVIMNKEVPEEVYKEMKKKVEAGKQKGYQDVEAKTSIQENTTDLNDDNESLGDESVSPRQKEIDEQKNNYKEMVDKINEERRAREERLENIKIKSEENKPNPNGARLKNIAYVLLTIAAICGGIFFLIGDFIIAIAIVLGAGILGCICLGISEIIKLLQLIYDLLYYDRKR